MKKVLFTLALIFGVFALGVLCTSAKDFTIPQCAVTPVIDGVFDEDNYEWDKAYHNTLTPSNGEFENIDWNAGVDRDEACPKYDVYMFWYNDPNESGDLWDIQKGGIYICVIAPDATRGADPGTGAYNATDVIQFLCDPRYSRRADNKRTYCYDFAPWTSTGKADWYEHYQYGSKAVGLGVQVVSKVTNKGYTMEIFVPWIALNINERLPEHKVGTKMGMGFVYMDWIGMSYYYNALDFGDGRDIPNCTGNAKTLNTATFGETVYPENYTGNGDTTQLEALLLTTDAIVAAKADYTLATYMAFEEALNAAKAITRDNTQEQVDAAYAKLDSAIKALAKTADLSVYEQLLSAIAVADTLIEEEYEPDTWAALQTALTAAKAIKADSPEADIEKANTDLTIAIDSLLRVGEEKKDADLSAIKNLINQIDLLKEADYTAESWAALMAEYDKAKALTAASSQYEVDLAAKALSEAKEALVKVGGESGSDDPTDTPDDNAAGLPVGAIIGIVAGGVVVVAAVVVIVLIVLKKKKNA